MAFKIYYRLEDLLLFSEIEALLVALIECFPDEVLYKAARVVAFVRRGDVEKGKILAANYTDNVEAYIEKTTEQLDKFRKIVKTYSLSM